MTQLEYDPKYVSARVGARLEELEMLNRYFRNLIAPDETLEDAPGYLQRAVLLQDCIFQNLKAITGKTFRQPLNYFEYVEFTSELISYLRQRNEILHLTFEYERLLSLTDHDWSELSSEHKKMLQHLDWIFDEMACQLYDS